MSVRLKCVSVCVCARARARVRVRVRVRVRLSLHVHTFSCVERHSVVFLVWGRADYTHVAAHLL